MSIQFLYIDDNPHHCDFVRRILRAWGLHCVKMTDSRDGISFAVEAIPRLIMTDINMRPLSGYEVLIVLRQVPELNHTPIIALTAAYSDRTRSDCLKRGFDDFYGKPLLRKELEQIVRKFLTNENKVQP